MSGALIAEQLLNGLQMGLMLFLLAAGLTLIFGIMDMINLAHGSLYMIGAYLMAALTQAIGSFWLALPIALIATAIIGMLLEISLLRPLYRRDHLSQVLATFALILISNEIIRIVFGDQALTLNPPTSLSSADCAGLSLSRVSPRDHRRRADRRNSVIPIDQQNSRRHVGARRRLESRYGHGHGREH
jgi:branched-subunit amino acid ABC-type transport system permease component